MDYNHIRENFRIDVPKHFNFAFDVMDKHAETSRNRLAMIWTNEAGETKKLTYWDFKVYSNKVANFLKSLGVRKGDNVMLILPRVPEWWYAVLGCMKIGAVFVPSAISLTPKDLEYRCDKANVKVIITNDENTAKIDGIRSKIPTVESFVTVDNEKSGWISFWKDVSSASRNFVQLTSEAKTSATDPLLLYFTSGTAGYPKMVQHNHAYPLAHRVTAELWHGLNESDIIWTITDTGWAKTAWGSLFGQWLMGSTIFVYDIRGRFNAANALSVIEQFGITVLCSPPTAYRLLILENLKKYDFSELKHCTSAGEPLNPEVIDVWHKGTGLPIYEGYGQTETVCIIATLVGMKIKPGSMGKPLPPFEIDVLDDDLKPCKTGHEGNIALKVKPHHPAGIFFGYIGDDETNKNAFVGDWYFTGDRAYKDEDGYFWFVGRRDDVIKSSDYRIGPFEVESALIEHPAVVEAAVVGVPDDIKGQAVKAFVILKAGVVGSEALIKELQEHVRNVTAPYKYPRYIEFVAELPKTISGKIRRVELREKELKKKPN
jgi:acetyl-CoA synthetase